MVECARLVIDGVGKIEHFYKEYPHTDIKDLLLHLAH